MTKIAKIERAPGTEAGTSPEGAPAAPRKRGRARRLALMAAVPVLLAVGGTSLWISGGRYEETENAYFHQARLTIASDLPGRVVEVDTADNQPVAKGDTLFRIDPVPYEIALSEADAALAAARLQVEQLKAAYEQARAQEKAALEDVDYAEKAYDRQTALSDRGVATTAQLDDSEHALRAAQEKLTAARQTTLAARAALGDEPDGEVDAHPTVRAALAARESAAYNLEHTTLQAPSDGVVYQAAQFRTGQFVAAGEPLFALVETDDSWIDANFKETQIAHMVPGQAAQVSFDIYPGKTFAATVDAIGAGTGSEFSLLPAQNATGNWVKVTQRVPVRLRLSDPLPPDVRPISGASARVSVDTGVNRKLASLVPLGQGAD